MLGQKARPSGERSLKKNPGLWLAALLVQNLRMLTRDSINRARLRVMVALKCFGFLTASVKLMMRSLSFLIIKIKEML
jgi:hypothetical protein